MDAANAVSSITPPNPSHLIIVAPIPSPPPFLHRLDAGGGRRSNHRSNHLIISNHLGAHSFNQHPRPLAQPPLHAVIGIRLLRTGRSCNIRAPTQGCRSARTVTCHFYFIPELCAQSEEGKITYFLCSVTHIGEDRAPSVQRKGAHVIPKLRLQCMHVSRTHRSSVLKQQCP